MLLTAFPFDGFAIVSIPKEIGFITLLAEFICVNVILLLVL